MIRSFVALTLLCALGCGGRAGKAPDLFSGYPEVRAFAEDALMMVGPPATANDWAGVKKGAASPSFVSQAENIMNSTVPSGITNGAELKNDVDTYLKKLMEIAKTGKDSDVEAAYKDFKSAWDKLAGAVDAASR